MRHAVTPEPGGTGRNAPPAAGRRPPGSCACVIVPLLALAAGLGLAGCAEPAYPPVIREGSACAACGMSIEHMGFACEQRVSGSWRAYDSIECLLREGAPAPEVFLADYDAQTLHAADSMWVVRGQIDSPMGGGFAAFLAREAADDVAASTGGRVARLAAWAAGPAPGEPPAADGSAAP